MILHTALSEPCQDLADWPLGRRNQALAQVRCSCFGPQLEGWTACPRCHEKLEVQMDALALGSPVAQAPVTITHDGQSFRLPTSRDLALAALEADLRAAAGRLMDACHLGENAPRRWSEREIEEVGERIAMADPMAEISLVLDCPACGNHWNESLDIASFLWTEVASRAKRLLREVHAIASAYGWTEREILSLSDARRAMYLEMAGG